MNINAKGSLQGSVIARQPLSGDVAEKRKLQGDVNVGGTIKPEDYEGDYSVTPKVDSQVLATKAKYMVDDLVIKEIPFFDTSNTSGGRTIYIGDSVIEEIPTETLMVSDDGFGNVFIEGATATHDAEGLRALKSNGKAVTEIII